MLKFAAGVAVGVVFSSTLKQAYRRNKFPYQDRIEAAVYILVHGITYENEK